MDFFRPLGIDERMAIHHIIYGLLQELVLVRRCYAPLFNIQFNPCLTVNRQQAHSEVKQRLDASIPKLTIVGRKTAHRNAEDAATRLMQILCNIQN